MMGKCGFVVTGTLVTLGLLATAPATFAAVQSWRIDDATVTLSLDAEHLATLGLAVTGDRTTATSELPAGEILEGERHSYRLRSAAGVSFMTDEGAFAAFESARTARLPFEGGLSFRATHPRTQAALPPAVLYDFAV